MMLPPSPEQALQPQLTSELPPSAGTPAHDDPIWGHTANLADYMYQRLFGEPDKYGNLGKQTKQPAKPTLPPPPATAPGLQGLIPADASISAFTPQQQAQRALEQPATQQAIRLASGMIGSHVGPEGFFSHAENVLNETKQGVFTGEQLRGFLKSKGVKDEELKWSGLDALSKKAKVTKQEALEALGKAPRLSEVKLGSNIEAIRKAEERAYEASHNFASLHYELEEQYKTPHQSEWPPEAQQRWNDAYQESLAAKAEVDRLGDMRSAQYDRSELKLPGPHSNYREILLKHEPDPLQPVMGFDEWQDFMSKNKPGFTEGSPFTRRNEYDEYIRSMKHAEQSVKFTGSHWDEPNVVAHLRLNERRLPDQPGDNIAGKQFFNEGDKVLHADEYQSDWANAARKEGIGAQKWYVVQRDAQGNPTGPPIHTEPFPTREAAITARRGMVPYGDDAEERFGLRSKEGVEPAPYIEGSWPELTAKRHLLEAARDPDVKHVTWTTGAQQIDRYEQALKAVADRIDVNPDGSGLTLYKDGAKVNMPGFMKETETSKGWDNVERVLGPDLTNKLKAKQAWNAPTRQVLSLKGDTGDFKITAKWPENLYDKTQVSNFKKLTKQEPRLIDIQGGKPPFHPSLEEESKIYVAYDEPSNEWGYIDGNTGRFMSSQVFRSQSQAQDHLYDFASRLGRLPSKSGGQKVWSVPMTNELRKRILSKGFPLYSIVPPALMLGAARKTLLPPPPEQQQ